MGIVVKISKNSKPEKTRKALEKLSEKVGKKTRKKLADFYGKMPGVYGDGLTYQKK
ncbi:MAG TPA: hypothetical protein VMU83_12500 [Hanamia sp.]|nr:hypothetical protein [Hanamia sp.]